MIRQALMRFMYGRNGIDQLGTFMLVLYLITWVIQLISHWFFLILLECRPYSGSLPYAVPESGQTPSRKH